MEKQQETVAKKYGSRVIGYRTEDQLEIMMINLIGDP